MAELYTKDVSYFTPDEVGILYARYRKLSDALESSQAIAVTQVVNYDNCHLIFKKVNLLPTFEQRLFAGEQFESHVYQTIGEALAYVHCVDRSDIQDEGIIWGDYSTKNMHVQENGVVILFDAEPPSYASGKLFDSFINASAYVDISRFIFSLFVSDSMKRPWRLFNNHNQAISTFLHGYEQVSDWTVLKNELKRQIRLRLEEWKEEKKAHHNWLVYIYKYTVMYIAIVLHEQVFQWYVK